MAADPSPFPVVVAAPCAPPGFALLDAGLDMAYQPIVHLGSGSVIAYEALARPRHPTVAGPAEFFRVLEEAGLRLAGERSAFCAAIRGIAAANGARPHRRAPTTPPVKLFVNASPLTLVDGDFDVGELLDLAEAHGIPASDLVIEVTESEEVDDLAALTRRVQRLRRLGIGVAVDDAGAGHASFRVITRLRPNYIKIDRDLISSVDTDGARQAFIEAMVRFARQIGSRLVAEGIETEGELASLAGLGVEAGQGYFLARPSIEGLVTPSAPARRMIAAAAQRLRLGAPQVTVDELVRQPALEDPATPVGDVYERFRRNPSLQTLLVTARDRVGALVTRRSLERLLAGPDGWARHAARPVGEVAEHHQLTVSAGLDIVEVAAILSARRPDEVADDVVVSDLRGRLTGLVDVRDIVRTLGEVRSDSQLNPLTGMNGHAWLEAELGRRLDVGEAATVVFLDVDSFRRINELGGFALGDETIRALGRCLTGVVGGVAGGAAAHVGGDDFVLVVPPRGYEQLVAGVVGSFESEVMPFLRTELRLHAFDYLCDQIALSMGAVDLFGEPPAGHRYLDWARDGAAQLMAMAKRHAAYAAVHGVGDDTAVTTWTAGAGRDRTVSLGLVEPSVVLRALDLIDASWARWWSAEPDSHDGPASSGRFPGPLPRVDRLHAKFGAPLRAQAEAAVSQRLAVMEVVLHGAEHQLLELLDRIALVTRQAYDVRRLPIPAEVALLDRLLRQRARVIVRQDVVRRPGVEA